VFTAAVLLAAVRCIRFIVLRFRRRLPVTVDALDSKRAYVNGTAKILVLLLRNYQQLVKPI